MNSGNSNTYTASSNRSLLKRHDDGKFAVVPQGSCRISSLSARVSLKATDQQETTTLSYTRSGRNLMRRSTTLCLNMADVRRCLDFEGTPGHDVLLLIGVLVVVLLIS